MAVKNKDKGATVSAPSRTITADEVRIDNGVFVDEETFNENFGTEWFISAKEALDFGIAHKIIEDIDEIYS